MRDLSEAPLLAGSILIASTFMHGFLWEDIIETEAKGTELITIIQNSQEVKR